MPEVTVSPDLGDDANHSASRVQSISAARDNVRDVRQQISYARATGEISHEKANSILRAAVEDYIMEVEYLATTVAGGAEDDDEAGSGDLDSVNGDYYWQEVELGEMVLYCPESILNEVPDNYQYNLNPGDQQQFVFNGLGSIIDAPERISQVFTLEVPALPMQEPRRARVQRQIPEDVLMRAFRTVNHFVGEVGLDVSFTEGMPKWGFEEVGEDAAE